MVGFGRGVGRRCGAVVLVGTGVSVLFGTSVATGEVVRVEEVGVKSRWSFAGNAGFGVGGGGAQGAEDQVPNFKIPTAL